MVYLITQDKLNSLNIDTVERAIVLAALALRVAIVGRNGSNFDNDKVKITTSERSTNQIDLRLDVSLPFNPYLFASSGGILINSISTLDATSIDLNSQLNFTVTQSENITESIATYPNNLPRNFESYLYFYASILMASLAEDRNQFVRITPKGNGFDGSEVRLRITLPIDAKAWGLGKNLVECVQRISDVYLTDNYYGNDNNNGDNSGSNNGTGGNNTGNNQASLLTDDMLLDDNILLVDTVNGNQIIKIILEETLLTDNYLLVD